MGADSCTNFSWMWNGKQWIMTNFNIFDDELNKKEEKNLCDDVSLLMTSMYKNIMRKSEVSVCENICRGSVYFVAGCLVLIKKATYWLEIALCIVPGSQFLTDFYHRHLVYHVWGLSIVFALRAQFLVCGSTLLIDILNTIGCVVQRVRCYCGWGKQVKSQ